jgi:hypothetical protein
VLNIRAELLGKAGLSGAGARGFGRDCVPSQEAEFTTLVVFAHTRRCVPAIPRSALKVSRLEGNCGHTTGAPIQKPEPRYGAGIDIF